MIEGQSHLFFASLGFPLFQQSRQAVGVGVDIETPVPGEAHESEVIPGR